MNILKKIGYWLIADDTIEINASNAVESVNYARGTIGSAKSSHSGLRDVNGMNFTVYNAVGGKVIQFTTYDPTRDRTNTTLYIITDNDNFGEELGQIITKESLSR